MEVDVADLCPPVSEAVSFETSSCVGLLFSRFLLGGLEGALLILGFSSARCGSAAAVVSGMISSVVKDERAVRFAGASLAAVWGESGGVRLINCYHCPLCDIVRWGLHSMALDLGPK